MLIMTNEELIEKLKNYHPKMEVMIMDPRENGFMIDPEFIVHYCYGECENENDQ